MSPDSGGGHLRAQPRPTRTRRGRGLSYWSDGKEERILYVTPGYQRIALDANTGGRIQSFGTNGIVDLQKRLAPLPHQA